MKLLTAALLATIIGTAAMADTVQVFKPDEDTETFYGVHKVQVIGDGIFSLKDADGEVIANVINMPMIIRPENKDEPDGPALPPKRRPFPDVTVSPGFSQNFTGGKINLAGGATRGMFNVEENTSFEESDQ